MKKFVVNVIIILFIIMTMPTILSAKENYADVNNYIKTHKFRAAKIEYNHNPSFLKFNYRNGYGMVEGVVAHETANDDSTILKEISYMSRNHHNAFVHAFADHNRIIEIHPTEFGAWGAGKYANQRFVHIELVRVDSYDQFARSINNYAYYIASVLYDNALGVTSADSSGTGTLWSHNAVSKHLGGTNHSDPHGYFSRYGYSWNQFVSLVTEKHSELIASKKANTSKLGKIKYSNAYIYQNPTNLNNRTIAGATQLNKVFYIKAQSKLKGKTYYLISNLPSSKNATIGWVESKDITTLSHLAVDSVPKTFYLKGKGVAYDRPWGGSKNVVYTSNELAQDKYDRFDVHLTQKVGTNTWYRGSLNGKTVWIHGNHLTIKEESSTSRLGKVNDTSVKIYSNDQLTTAFTAGSEYMNNVYYIKKQMKLDGNTYYLISEQPSSVNGIIGWVNSKDITTLSHLAVDSVPKTYYLKGKGIAYNRPWGGSKNVVYTSNELAQDKYERFDVHLTQKVGTNTWYRGVLNGKTVWIHGNHLTIKEESSTSRLGKVNDTSVRIYSNDQLTTAFTAGTEYMNNVYYIKKQMKLDGNKYYLISEQPSSVNGIIGWVNSKDITTLSHLAVDSVPKTFYLKGKGVAYNRPWGGGKNVVYTSNELAQYKYERFDVHLTQKVGTNTWYRGEFRGGTMWIHSSHLDKK
ncbi:peptidoglycan recognition protein family protein [Paucisalibacillus globulus]|uniref:peptidoglycan recognition protein family protein n=1 Tax=Paucisalibacillus globulus TaxID=351095 RepID=UPI00041AC252|nr:GW dipeptide domain-containing protein [Paucisalibacillus globulus]